MECVVACADVLVIGGGAAGLRAAAEAAALGTSVTLCSKSTLGTGGSTFLYPYGSIGINAITHPETGDNVDRFFQEIIEAGGGAVQEDLAWILAEQATDRFIELEKRGVRFKRGEDGGYRSVIPCFGKRMRGANANVIEYRNALLSWIRAEGVCVLEHTAALELIAQDGVCHGAILSDSKGKVTILWATATIIATGGNAGSFAYAESSPECCGESYAMAYDAGARLINLEFIQFAPAIVWPMPLGPFLNKALLSGFTLENKNGEQFLRRYIPNEINPCECIADRVHDDPFSSSNRGKYFDIALYEEWRIGKACEHGGLRICFDRRMLRDNPYPFVMEWAEDLNRRGVDPFGEGFEILPHAFSCNGGVLIDCNAQTDVAGLFAAGEAAGGMHGADRLGGNAMAATQVFGRIAGANAAQYASRSSARPLDSALKVFSQLMMDADTGNAPMDCEEASARLKRILWQGASLCRSEERIDEALNELRIIAREVNPAASIREGTAPQAAFALKHQLTSTELTLRAVRLRQESRGAHYRGDHPIPDQRYCGYFTLRRDCDMVRCDFHSASSGLPSESIIGNCGESKSLNGKKALG